MLASGAVAQQRLTLRARLRARLSLAASPVGTRPIGGRAWIAAAGALLALGADLALALESWPVRLAPACASFALTAALARDRAALGLALRPAPSVRYWLVATLVIGAAMALVLALVGAIALAALGPGILRLPPHVTPDWITGRLGLSVGQAPIFEELIYRLAPLCALASAFGRPIAVAIGGAAFAALHFRYGNPSADNFVAGFFFAWAFFKSGTPLVPMVLHALGNLSVALILLAGYYLQVAP